MKKVQLTERDLTILHSLWKWKLLSSSGIWKGFFPNSNARTCFNRLCDLEKGGFIDCRTINDGGKAFTWMLSRKGFSLIKKQLPELKEEGYQSENREHDFYVTAAHAGEWLSCSPVGVELFSEQELRRFSCDHYPEWVPSSEMHRPDGYWRVPFEEKKFTLALEVELTQKSASRYQVTAAFYDQYEHIFRANWIVGSQALGEQIRTQISLSATESVNIHNFLLLSDFKKLGWDAKVFLGREKDLPLRNLLNYRASKNPVNLLALHLLDFRKMPGGLITSTTPQNT